MSARQPDLSTNDGCHAFQVINGDGKFNRGGLEDFATEVQLNRNPSYAVIAIIGPQSSGKSTLLNHLFDTKFRVMDSSSGRSQTTQGIWLACPNIASKHLMLLMDIEGTDGSEREDNTTFEKQSALFALAVANVVIVNLWCHDIGREQGASKPLLAAVFQQVKMKFCDKPRKITLMFVIRDKELSPVEVLEDSLRANIDKIWNSIPMPKGSSNIRLDEVFDVKVAFLPHYVYQNEDFKTEVQKFKGKLVDQCTAAGDQEQPASGFSLFVRGIWKKIKRNKNLDLPAHKVMVATIRCEQIKTEKYDTFEMNKDWFELCKAIQLGNFGSVGDLWRNVNSILNVLVEEYDKETSFFVEKVRTEKRDMLVDKLLQLVEPEYRYMLNHLRREQLKKFMETFDKISDGHINFSIAADDCNQKCLKEFDNECKGISIDLSKWDTLTETAELQIEMSSYITTRREDKLASKIKQFYEPKLKQELSHSVGHFLCEETDPNWSKIREHYKKVTNSIISSLENTFLELGVNEDDQKAKRDNIEKYAKDVIVAKAREESGRAEHHMKRKFDKLFKYELSRDRSSNEEIEAAARNSLQSPLKLLVGLVAIRLEDSDAADSIEYMLASAFLGSEYIKALETLNSPTWPQIQRSKTLITPPECEESWDCFLQYATVTTSKVLGDLQRKNKKKPKWELFERLVSKIKSIASKFSITANKRKIAAATETNYYYC